MAFSIFIYLFCHRTFLLFCQDLFLGTLALFKRSGFFFLSFKRDKVVLHLTLLVSNYKWFWFIDTQFYYILKHIIFLSIQISAGIGIGCCNGRSGARNFSVHLKHHSNDTLCGGSQYIITYKMNNKRGNKNHDLFFLGELQSLMFPLDIYIFIHERILFGTILNPDCIMEFLMLNKWHLQIESIAGPVLPRHIDCLQCTYLNFSTKGVFSSP